MTGRRFIGEKLWNGASLFHGIVYARYAREGAKQQQCERNDLKS